MGGMGGAQGGMGGMRGMGGAQGGMGGMRGMGGGMGGAGGGMGGMGGGMGGMGGGIPDIYLAMPNEKILVLFVGNFGESKIETMLKADSSKPNISQDLLTTMKAVENEPIWFAIQSTDAMNNKFGKALDDMIVKAPEMKPAREVVSQVKAYGGSVTFGETVQISLNITMATQGAASQMARGLNDGWQKVKPELAKLKDTLAFIGMQDFAPVIDDIVNTTSIKEDGSLVKTSMTFSKQTVDKLKSKVKEAMDKAKNPGGGGVRLK
jgi:hypothetical protein